MEEAHLKWGGLRGGGELRSGVWREGGRVGLGHGGRVGVGEGCGRGVEWGVLGMGWVWGGVGTGSGV